MQLSVHGPVQGTRLPGSGSGACWLVPCSPRSPPLAPPAPASVARHRSPASQLLWRGLTSRPRASPASAHHLPDADQGATDPGQRRDLPVPAQGAYAHAGVYDRAGPARRSRWRACPCCLPLNTQCRRPGGVVFAAQYPAYAHPCQRFANTLAELQRMTRGQCGSLDLHWQRLALFTPCRSPGARIVKLTSIEHASRARIAPLMPLQRHLAIVPSPRLGRSAASIGR